jgi:dipeptidyl aminopeptidase/acylaminoacyl peptidase
MRTAPYGSWLSPITSEFITRSTIRLSGVHLDGDDVYWTELRPREAGRTVIVRRAKNGEISDVTPESFNVRTLAHEYGGGSYTVHKGIVYFCNFADQRIYRQKLGGKPEALTAEAKVYWADLIVDEHRNRLLCVQEDHSEPGQEAITTISSVSLKDGSVEMIIAGNDFYAYPRLSPNGMFMSWMSWNHPNMPWDESFVWAGNVASDGSVSNMRQIAGAPGESVFQPQWSHGGDLYYVSDRSGWWNLYKHTDYEGEFAVAERDAEFGQPMWIFGYSTYAFSSEDRIICDYCHRGMWTLAELHPETQQLTDFDLPYTDFQSVKANAHKAYFIAGSPTDPPAVCELDLKTKQCTVIRTSGDVDLEAGYFSRPQPIEFPTTGGRMAHAFFYPPQNRDFKAPDGEMPPLLVKSHGGPTSAASSTLNLAIQYWTSRGFAVVDVNYGGSTGYGREYRSRLYNSWGIVDVEDCVHAATHLVEHNMVDPDRLAISGGSAGGYTTLCALTFHKLFKAGASHYGISDLEAMTTDTHKFESRYLDRLVGPFPLARQVYEERSPIHHVEKMHCPVIFFQGLEDKIVPPNQSEMMVNALRKRSIPVAYVKFEGEQHGFRKAENIRRALDGELYFYSQIFKFDLAEKIEPVEIENLDKAKIKGRS